MFSTYGEAVHVVYCYSMTTKCIEITIETKKS